MNLSKSFANQVQKAPTPLLYAVPSTLSDVEFMSLPATKVAYLFILFIHTLRILPKFQMLSLEKCSTSKNVSCFLQI